MAKFTFGAKTRTIAPVGECILAVLEVSLTLTSRTREDMVKITCMACSPEHEYLDIYDYFPLTAKMGWKFAAFLAAIKREQSEGTTLDITQKWLNENVKGAIGWGLIIHETFDDKPIAKIEKWLEVREIIDPRDEPGPDEEYPTGPNKRN